MDKEMQKALEEDAKKLRDLTGEDHQVQFWDDYEYTEYEWCEECGIFHE